MNLSLIFRIDYIFILQLKKKGGDVYARVLEHQQYNQVTEQIPRKERLLVDEKGRQEKEEMLVLV